MFLAASFDVDAVRIALEHPFRALHEIDPAVGPRQVGAVLHHHGLPFRGLDQARVHVALRVAFGGPAEDARRVTRRPRRRLGQPAFARRVRYRRPHRGAGGRAQAIVDQARDADVVIAMGAGSIGSVAGKVIELSKGTHA